MYFFYLCGDTSDLFIGDPSNNVDGLVGNSLGVLCGNILDVHASLGRRDDYWALFTFTMSGFIGFTYCKTSDQKAKKKKLQKVMIS